MTTARTDAQLVLAGLAGDLSAFGELLARHERAVTATAAACAGMSAADDVVQEAFVAAWKNLARLRAPEQARAWLCGIARTLARAENRRRRRVERLAASQPDEPHGDLRAELLARERERVVERALAALPAGDREALILFYFEDASTRRVADALGVGEDTAAKRISRARDRLGQALEQQVAPALERRRPRGTAIAAALATIAALTPVASAGTPSSSPSPTGKTTMKLTGKTLAFAAICASTIALLTLAPADSASDNHRTLAVADRVASPDSAPAPTDSLLAGRTGPQPLRVGTGTGVAAPPFAGALPAFAEPSASNAFEVHVESPDDSLTMTPALNERVGDCIPSTLAGAPPIDIRIDDGGLARVKGTSGVVEVDHCLEARLEGLPVDRISAVLGAALLTCQAPDAVPAFELSATLRRVADAVAVTIDTTSLAADEIDEMRACLAAAIHSGDLAADPATLELSTSHVGGPLPKADLVGRMQLADGPGWGPAGAPVTITAFIDYGCPFSRQLVAALDELADRFPDKLRFVIRHFVLAPERQPLALAALAAAAMGRFEPMFDQLMSGPEQSATELPALARAAGLDPDRLLAAIEAPATRARLDEDVALATAMGVEATPTFFIGAHRITGARPADNLAVIIEDLLRASP